MKCFVFSVSRRPDAAAVQEKTGVCGKSAAVSGLQDELTGALIGLARAASGASPDAGTHRAMLEGLFTTVTNVNFSEETVKQQIRQVHQAKNALLSGCGECSTPCGKKR